jgi:hypothetical protein
MSGQPWSWLGETYRFLAEACLGQGKLRQALEAAQQALALSQEYAQQEQIGQAWRVLGEFGSVWPVGGDQGLEVGDQGLSSEPPGAEEALPDPATCFAESMRVFGEIWNEPERARALRAWARYELAHGDRETGDAMWQEARLIFVRFGMALEVERMDRELPPR